MGIETIKVYVAWCKDRNIKPCYASSVEAYTRRQK